MHQLVKIVFFGFLTWLIPFITSFFFFQKGQMIIPEAFFKSIMIVVSFLAGAVLTVKYFQAVHQGYRRQGIILGLVWLLLNLGFDLLLVNRGFFPMSYTQYFTNIGLRYLAIPTFTTAVGVVVHQAVERMSILEKPEENVAVAK